MDVLRPRTDGQVWEVSSNNSLGTDLPDRPTSYLAGRVHGWRPGSSAGHHPIDLAPQGAREHDLAALDDVLLRQCLSLLVAETQQLAVYVIVVFAIAGVAAIERAPRA